MKVPANLYRGGDHYPQVRVWMQKLSTADLDKVANGTALKNRDSIRIYVEAILGKGFDLRFRVLHGSEGRGWHEYITLDRNLVDAGQMSLGTVLHECAHAIQSRKDQDHRQVRRKLRLAGRLVRPQAETAHRATHHGEPFCRTYARLLRETLT